MRGVKVEIKVEIKIKVEDEVEVEVKKLGSVFLKTGFTNSILKR